ncbi:DUF262 and DUF1524 domain-containing protein [Leptospira kanakyensis]|uniref:DUF262 and DUF1524 domain-containing protein n=1 Tax=Leptospira kanakyensis TaxID=2484968 RepID=UPI00223D4588|nr:DUF262 and DUF1524 domain-containing protein [Leptospira kanakyensis]MCW7470571.1 DUF262 and DUF1524 domain-containing protein [Leptospira kanakyensis]
MKATEAKLLDFLKKSPQFVIPIYQRTYSWTIKECRQLWDDIFRSGSNDNVSIHFLGSIVYIESGLSQVTHQAPLLVIDGQQRLTTIMLILASLASEIEDTEPFAGFTQRKLRNYYLVNPEESGDRYFKLLLTHTDNASLKAVINNTDQPNHHSLRIMENFELFQRLITENKSLLPVICKGLAKLAIVDIALNREHDNPQLIFESMNSTGKELSQADLIRNFILMGLKPKFQTKLYEDYWRPMEIDFGQESYSAHFDSFMRHYLTFKTGDIPNINSVYEAFKAYSYHSRNQSLSEEEHIENLVKDIIKHSKNFCSMALDKEIDFELKTVFRDLQELKVDVAFPLLLELYEDYENSLISKDHFSKIVRMIESYVFRRAICMIPTNSMNLTFAKFSKGIDKKRYYESVEAQFQILPSYRRFPSDEEFYRDIQTRDLYNFRSRRYWLRRIENFNRKESVLIDEYTIEHIMPQNENLNDKWRSSLGNEWKKVQQTWLHTLGNLTLTGYNSEYSDKSFSDKCNMDGGFKQSPLKLNEELGNLEFWNEDSIKNRAKRLANLALEIWKAPKLNEIILKSYKPKKTSNENYSINDHPNLLTPNVRILFEAFRKEVLSLDPCVNEEFLKLYVAYKAETNFVDVVPQARRLRISLNMRFSEISDPKGLCRDITELGRWGNGDVEISLSNLDELPYVIGLVRQSLELQLGEKFER